MGNRSLEDDASTERTMEEGDKTTIVEDLALGDRGLKVKETAHISRFSIQAHIGSSTIIQT